MSETQAVYQNSQQAAAGASSSPTPGAIGSTGAVRARSASTSGAASATVKKRKSTRNADKTVTVEQALTVAQDIVRMAHRAGLHSHVVNLGNGDTAIVLCGVFYCPTCRNLSHGAKCQKCESQNG